MNRRVKMKLFCRKTIRRQEKTKNTETPHPKRTPLHASPRPQSLPHKHTIDHLLHRLNFTLRHPPPPLPPHNRQHRTTSSKKHTKRHAQTPNSFRLKTLRAPTARPPRQTHDRTPFLARRKRHGERPGRFGAAGRAGAADCAAIEVREGLAEEDGDCEEG